MTQAGPAGLFTAEEVCLPVVNTFKQVFKSSRMYHAHCPAFFDHYSFVMGSQDVDLTSIFKGESIEQLIEERVDATHETGASPSSTGNNVPLAIDEETLRAAFVWPKWLKALSAQNQVIISDSAPSFLT